MEQLINDIQSIYNRIKNSENAPQIERDLLKKKIMELYEAAITMDSKVTFESITNEGTVEVDNLPFTPEMSAYDILEEKDEAFVTLEMEEAEKEMFDDEELFDEEPAVGDISYTPPAEEQKAASEEEIIEEPKAEEQEEELGIEEEVTEPAPIEEPINEPVAETPQAEETPNVEELIKEPEAEIEETPAEKPQPELEPEPVAETPQQEPAEEVEQPVAETTEKEEEEPPRIIEQLSLNDMAAEGSGNSDLAKKYTETPIEDLLRSIPVYKRYEFIAELFKNDNEGFDQAVKEINGSATADAAFEYVHDTLKPKYNWDEDNELVMDFVAFVRRRFTR